VEAPEDVEGAASEGRRRLHVWRRSRGASLGGLGMRAMLAPFFFWKTCSVQRLRLYTSLSMKTLSMRVA
jgi:hypothetical protein